MIVFVVERKVVLFIAKAVLIRYVTAVVRSDYLPNKLFKILKSCLSTCPVSAGKTSEVTFVGGRQIFNLPFGELVCVGPKIKS